jgi:hypothetical protein
MSGGLSAEELAAIAEAFPVGPAAEFLLSRAGFPRQYVPSMIGVSPAVFWRQANQELEAGVLENGRDRILSAAAQQYPGHPVLGVRRTRNIRSVLLVGAAPDGLPPMRPDRDLAEAIRAVEHRGISIAYRPAADITDLEVMATDPPDLLHLACHGDGEFLLFEGTDGPRPVAIEDLIAVLASHAGTAGRRLRGLYLATCEGAGQAERFAAVAEQVVAFAGEVPDSCAPAFAAHLYRALVSAPDLRSAAGTALTTLVATRQSCRSLASRLIVHPAAVR